VAATDADFVVGMCIDQGTLAQRFLQCDLDDVETVLAPSKRSGRGDDFYSYLLVILLENGRGRVAIAGGDLKH
jgi:hypothetical protein